MTEEKLHKQICQYISAQYPKLIFNTDLSGLKLTMGQAIKAKNLRSSNGFPDILILEPKIYGNGEIEETQESGDKLSHIIPIFWFCGLFLEVKKESPYLKDGTTLKKMKRSEKINGIKLEYDHLQRQDEMHKKLRMKGYMATFVWSFDMAKKVIDNYMK